MSEIKFEDHSTNNQRPGWRDLILYIGVGFGLYFLATLVLLVIFGEDFQNGSISLIVAIGILNGLCLIGTVYLAGVRRGKISWDDIGFIPPKMTLQWFLLALLASFILIPVRALVGALIELGIFGDLESLQMRGDLFFSGAEPLLSHFLISMLVIAIIVPISEELFFRGLLFRWFRLRYNTWTAIIGSSLLFGLAHYDSLAVVISSFVLGVVNAYAMERTKSVWVPILMHTVTNGLAVIMVYLVMFLEPYLEPLL